jgi:putative phosphoesterase
MVLTDLAKGDLAKGDSVKRMGVISDTHGLLRPQVSVFFEGVDLIAHAGDVGSMEIVKKLEKIAPVKIVRGNMDAGIHDPRLLNTDMFEFAGRRFYLVHNLYRVHPDLVDFEALGVHAVIHGHTHIAQNEEIRGIRYINPGSAGPIRLGKAVTLGVLSFFDGRIHWEVKDLL